MVTCTDDGEWNKIWYVSETLPKNIATTRSMFTKFKENPYIDHDFKHSVFSQGIDDVFVTTKNHKHMISSVSHTSNMDINILCLEDWNS